MYKLIFGVTVLLIAGLSYAAIDLNVLNAFMKSTQINSIVDTGVLDLDVQVKQPIANVSVTSVVWLFGFALIGFALFVNRSKV